MNLDRLQLAKRREQYLHAVAESRPRSTNRQKRSKMSDKCQVGTSFLESDGFKPLNVEED